MTPQERQNKILDLIVEFDAQNDQQLVVSDLDFRRQFFAMSGHNEPLLTVKTQTVPIETWGKAKKYRYAREKRSSRE